MSCNPSLTPTYFFNTKVILYCWQPVEVPCSAKLPFTFMILNKSISVLEFRSTEIYKHCNKMTSGLLIFISMFTSGILKYLQSKEKETQGFRVENKL